METEHLNATVVSGLVKWFDQAKGFGFILSDDGGNDILLHANVLRNFGRNSVAERSRISVRTHHTQRGLQAFEILEISPPDTELASPIQDLGPEVIEHLDSIPLRPARIKWFDKTKGFGFANIFGLPDDVFVHIEVLRYSGFSDMVNGEAIGMRAVEGPRGLIAAQVTSWDQAVNAASEVMPPLPVQDAKSDGVYQLHRAAE